MTRSPSASPASAAPAARPATHPSRRAVLDAAARLFRHQGYAATSLRNIAEAAGMQAGSLYYHFDSKEEIVAEVLHTGIETVLHAVEAAVGEARARGERGAGLLEVAIRAHLESLLRVSDYTSADVRIYAHVPPAIRRQNLALRDRYEEVWRHLLAEAARCGDLRPGVDLQALRLFLLGAMNGALEWYRPGQKSIERLARDLSAYLLHGIAARSRPVRPSRPARLPP